MWDLTEELGDGIGDVKVEWTADDQHLAVAIGTSQTSPGNGGVFLIPVSVPEGGVNACPVKSGPAELMLDDSLSSLRGFDWRREAVKP